MIWKTYSSTHIYLQIVAQKFVLRQKRAKRSVPTSNSREAQPQALSNFTSLPFGQGLVTRPRIRTPILRFIWVSYPYLWSQI